MTVTLDKLRELKAECDRWRAFDVEDGRAMPSSDWERLNESRAGYLDACRRYVEDSLAATEPTPGEMATDPHALGRLE